MNKIQLKELDGVPKESFLYSAINGSIDMAKYALKKIEEAGSIKEVYDGLYFLIDSAHELEYGFDFSKDCPNYRLQLFSALKFHGENKTVVSKKGLLSELN